MSSISQKLERIMGIWKYISYVKQIKAEDYLEYGFNKSQINELVRETKDMPLTKEYLRGAIAAKAIIERNLTISELAKILRRARESGAELDDAEKIEIMRRYIAEKHNTSSDESVFVRGSVVSDVSKAIINDR
jgi:imidazolonepropionase-like amidohydrolase